MKAHLEKKSLSYFGVISWKYYLHRNQVVTKMQILGMRTSLVETENISLSIYCMNYFLFILKMNLFLNAGNSQSNSVLGIFCAFVF